MEPLESSPTAGPSKVTIPRIQPDDPGAPSEVIKDKGHSRVGNACRSCRDRKVKCSEHTPRCDNCVADNLECVYGQLRRDKLKSATSKIKDLVQLLKDISPHVGDLHKARINQILEGDDNYDSSSVDDDDDDDTCRDAALGSSEGLSVVKKDIFDSDKSRATGYVGQGSEVHWFRHLATDKASQKGVPAPINPAALFSHPLTDKVDPSHSPTESTFYLDAENVGLDMLVDPLEIPPVEIAEKLVECYLSTVHKSFPILPDQFEGRFRKYIEAKKSGTPLEEIPNKWLAIMNLVFAIGAQYSHLIGAEWRGDERDHSMYMSRSIQLLGVWPFCTVPDLALVQICGLLSFYHLVVGHVSKAWLMIGIAIRMALGLGFHLRNENPKLPSETKETIQRTWWSLNAIECLLSAITGRPCVLRHDDCTVAFPPASSKEESSSYGPFDFISASSSKGKSPIRSSSSISEKDRRLQNPRSYLDAHFNIGVITQEVLAALYAPRTAQHSWSHIQKTIRNLLQELGIWKQGALSDAKDPNFPPLYGSRETLLLRFYFFSTKILITRPCLCRSDRRTEDQSHEPAKFDQEMAEACVEAALAMIDLLPDETNPKGLYENGPWWSIVHHIMQAVAVLLQELCGKDARDNRVKIKDKTLKVLRWLVEMRSSDKAAEKAYRLILRIVQRRNLFGVGELLTGLDDFIQATAYHSGPSSAPGHHVQDPYFAADHPVPQVPPLGEEYGGYYHGQYQASAAGLVPTSTDPPLTEGMEQPQTQWPMDDYRSDQPPHAEQYQFLDNASDNPYILANPFTTNFDQDAPLSHDDLWPQDSSQPSGNEGLAEQQNLDYQTDPFMMDHDQQGEQQHPH